MRWLVGGIYSVIKSKAPVTTLEYGDRYTLIGPYNRNSVGCDALVYSRSHGRTWLTFLGKCRG